MFLAITRRTSRRQELAYPLWTAQLQCDRAVGRFYRDREAEESTTLSFGFNGLSDLSEHVRFGRETKPEAIWNFAAFCRAARKDVQEVLTTRLKRRWTQRTSYRVRIDGSVIAFFSSRCQRRDASEQCGERAHVVPSDDQQRTSADNL